jgi:ADP-dependent NAD(P)H-hydrate dehydratase / NAD(P)H-hydrate epimerase
MQILDAAQIRAWDAYTIEHEPVSSFELMERAAKSCFHWLMANGYKDRAFAIYCGKGNNGGDGLAIARMLIESGHTVTIYILEYGAKGTDDFQANLALLHTVTTSIIFISSPQTIHPLPDDAVIIDALFGSGLNKPIEGLAKQIVLHINHAGNEVISIDVPSGMYCDKSSAGGTYVHARHTLSFHCYKLAFLMPENAGGVGAVHILDIGLHPGYLTGINNRYSLLAHSTASTLLRSRGLHDHKGMFGHAGLIAGSKGMMGAAIMAARACLRSGVGKLTCHLPESGYAIMQAAVPEAMCVVEHGNDFVASVQDLSRYTAVGIGPGLGMRDSNVAVLQQIFSFNKPAVIDADALNTLAANNELSRSIPPGSVLTPHPKEFERLFGKSQNDFERMETALREANVLQGVIVLKGHYTLIAAPRGTCYFNSTGNPGMAKGGSGDVLTGMILALLAQGYSAEEAACLGVYLHGRAADISVRESSYEALLPSDVIEAIGEAFRELYA